jgi:uncharacterized membrane-anchored protein YhcB (DUF1043 family)
MDKKMLTIIVAVIAIIGIGIAAYVVLNPGEDQKEKQKEEDAKKGGLYVLKADVLNVDMGGMSSTPKMVDTIAYMYEEVYGKLANGANKLTVEDMKKDTVFMETYCTFDNLATVNSDGSITYKTVLDSTSTLQSVTIPGPADRLIATGTAYPTILYYMLCYKYNVEPWSAAADRNQDLINEFRSINIGSLFLDSIETSTPELIKYYGSDYLSHCGSLKNYDTEMMGNDVKNNSSGHVLVLMGSGTIDKDNNARTNTIVTANGGYVLLNSATSIPSTFAGIAMISTVFGYGEYVDGLIEKLELQLYKIYWSAKQSETTHKAYFESSSGKASKNTGSGAELCKFFGWDISLFDGKEHDTENLLSEKPDVMIYYTNDTRTLDEKMRVTS